MAGLVPAIHVFWCNKATKTWMPGKRPGMTKEGDYAAFGACRARRACIAWL